MRLPPTRHRTPRQINRVPNLLLEADVVVRELAHLRVVHAEDLGLLVRAEAAVGDEVEDPADDGLGGYISIRMKGDQLKSYTKQESGRGSGEGGSVKLGRKATDRHAERVRKASDRVCELISELNVVVIEPTARDLGRAVEPGNARLREEGGEDVAHNAANAVRSEDLVDC